MLYDKRWDRTETKQDVFSLESLIAWLETMPPTQKYDWSRAETCLLGQWCASNGFSGRELRDKSIELGRWDQKHNALADAALGNVNECTFGAALARARAVQRSPQANAGPDHG